MTVEVVVCRNARIFTKIKNIIEFKCKLTFYKLDLEKLIKSSSASGI